MNELPAIATLLDKRNQIDRQISKIIGRPALSSHIGEFIASKIFGIKLERSARSKGIDGVFCEGCLQGKTVNVKLYGKQEGILDIACENLAEYYLVLTGPKSKSASSRGELRPTVISHVYLFNMRTLVGILKNRGVKIGVAASVRRSLWEEAEIYPNQRNNEIKLNERQQKDLKLFAP